MCGCADINTCHRKVLAERLTQRWGAALRPPAGAEVVHVAPPHTGKLPKTVKPESSGPPKLF